MAISLLRVSLLANPNPNFPCRSHQIHALHLLRHCRRRRLLRPLAFVVIRSPQDGAKTPPLQPTTSILIDVCGMMCGACVTHVKSALATDPRVDSAVVNALTESAAVRLRPEGFDGDADAVAEELVGKLTALGFPSRRRKLGVGVGENVRKWKERKEEMIRRSRNRVAFAWMLVALCCGGHASHLLHSAGTSCCSWNLQKRFKYGKMQNTAILDKM